jgi:hypothetical protein
MKWMNSSGARIVGNVSLIIARSMSLQNFTNRTMTSSALREKGGETMTDDERVLLIGIFMAVFLTIAIAVIFCME